MSDPVDADLPARRLRWPAAAAAAAAFVVAAGVAMTVASAGRESCAQLSERSAGVRCPPAEDTDATTTTGMALPSPPARVATTAGPATTATTTTEPATTTTTTTEVPVVVALPAAPEPSRPAVLLDITVPSPSLPNPFVLVDGDRYLLFATETRDETGHRWNVPVRVSADLVHWSALHDALPGDDVGAWASPEATWAPDVAFIGGGWRLFYTARLAGSDPATQCIGVATGDVPEGPYVPRPEPIVCQVLRGGSIDPRTYRDRDGTWWLHWKSDDNRDTEGTATSSIYAQPLDPTGTVLIGEPAAILEVTQRWEGRIVEAPHMVDVDGRRWLFYSGNWFNQPAYGIGVAVCDSPAGPCTKPYERPWLASNGQGSGPGEGSLFQDRSGRWRLIYNPAAQRYRTISARIAALATVGFDEHGPYLADPHLPG